MEFCREVDGASPSKKDEDSSETSFPELLNFASRVQTLISELLLLSDRIPPEFLDPRYDPVLFDLSYFDSPNDFEAKIDGNVSLEELEDELRESFSAFMQRFFLLANGIVVYHQELVKYLNELTEGIYVNSTLERVMEDEEGRQLLTESLALFGCLLLLLEHRMSGLLREKLLVAYLRNDRCFDAPNLEAICLLSRVHQVQSSSSSSPVMVSVQNPEDLLSRFSFPKQVVDCVLHCLKDCDLYKCIRYYPDPEHHYVALASQAGYLYVLLFYSLEMLRDEFVMREIVDRFFNYSLVVPIFLYFTVDLSLSWDAYKGAKASLSSCLLPSCIRDHCQLHYLKVKDLSSELCSALSHGVLNREYVLNNSQPLLSLVRNCNISLRWLLLHRTSNDKKIRDTVTSAGTSHQIEEEALLSFLLKTSQFEFEVKQLFSELLESKRTLLDESKRHTFESMQELNEYLSGSQITDAVYVWGFIGNFTQTLYKKIKQDSSIVLSLHSLFLKFRPMLDAPILRVSQNQSPDLPFVSAYYSSEYVVRVSAILEIIPAMLFVILNDDVVYKLQPFYPQKHRERDSLQSFLKPDPQFHVTKALAQISIFSKGLLLTSRTLSGFIDLDMKTWIEDKIRKELSKIYKEKLKSLFLYPSGGLEELEMKLQTLTTYFLSQRHLMEFLQDLIDVQGTLLWEEEFTCFLKHCVRKECDDFVSRRNQGSIVMPAEVNDFSNAQTFLGHLLCQIIKLTKPSRSMYIEPMSGWFDAEGCELLGLRFFELLESCVGPVGLASLDSLLVFFLTEHLKLALKGLKKLQMDARCLEQFQMLDTALGLPTSLPLLGWSSYQQMAKLLDTLWEPWVESLACIGQLQLIRCLITLKLNSACKVNAGAISSALAGMITSVSYRRQKLLMGNGKESCGTAELLLHELSKQGALCGFCTPLQTIYISEDPPAFLGRCASVVTISQLSRYVLDTHLDTLTSHSRKVSLDFSPVVIGLGTFLRQFHSTCIIQYVQYMGQYIRIAAETYGDKHEPQKGAADPTSEALKSICWLMYFCKHMDIPKDLVDSFLPPSLLAVLQV